MRHEQIDDRSRVMHALIAERVRFNPSYLDVAKSNLARWREQRKPAGGDLRTFNEWETLLNGDFDRLLELLASRDERATRLRQSSPFVGEPFLSASEREEIFQAFRDPIRA
jgi:hypothetical protein